MPYVTNTEDAELALWEVRELRPGETTVYYRGFILKDRSKSTVRKLADEVYRRAREGGLLLTQQRLEPVVVITRRGNTITRPAYAYLATRPRHA